MVTRQLYEHAVTTVDICARINATLKDSYDTDLGNLT